MANNLYQLRSKSKMHTGSKFYVNGPYDLWGIVLKSEHKPSEDPYATVNGEWLNLIRGTGKQRPS
jgi:hypothetical protein